MLIMPVHDISKISPPVLSKQLSIGCTCHLLHRGLLAHPANRYAIFSLGDGGLVHPSPFTFSSLEVMGFLCLQDKQTTGSCAIDCLHLVTGGGTCRHSFPGSPKGRETSMCESNFRYTVVYVIFNLNYADWGQLVC